MKDITKQKENKMEKCNVDNLTYGQIKELKSLFGGGVTQHIQNANQDHPFEIGKKYLIRTVTMIQTGMVKSIRGKFLVLEQAAWIADTGRFSDALAKAEFNEVEPFPAGRIIINRSCVIDAVEITKIQRSKK